MTDPRYLRKGFGFALAHAIEECGEFVAAAGKTQRWGPHSFNPELPPEQQEINLHWILREIGDVEDAMQRLRSEISRCFGLPQSGEKG